MATPRNYSKKKLAKIHVESMKLFLKSQSAQWPERLQCLQDRRFAAVDGAQWEEFSGQFQNRPKLQVNKLMSSIDRILAEMRRNPVSVKFISKDGTNVDDFAQMASSMFRADEQDSFADEAYHNGSADAVMGGLGAWRLTSQYENEIDEEGPQRICFEPIADADSTVFFDLGSKRKNKSDAKHCWVINNMPIETFKEQYSGFQSEFPEYGTRYPSDVAQLVHQSEFDWFTPAMVKVIEHYFIEAGSENVYTYTHLSGETKDYTDDDFEDDDTLKSTLRKQGWKVSDTKVRKFYQVHKTIEDGLEVIEDCGVIAGRYIPIILQYGKRFFIDNVERCQGVVRLGKDVQRLLNMEISLLAQIAGSSSFEKPIFAPEQVAKYKEMYENDNVELYAYMLADPIRGADGSIVSQGPIGMMPSPKIPEALGAIYAQTQSDIKDVMGQDKDAVTVQSNVSGEAVKLIIDQINLFALSYMQERADSVKHTGVVWFWMAKDLYVESDRQMKAVLPDGSTSSVKLNQQTTKDGADATNTFANASFDVVATTEPGLVSKKAELTRSLLGLLQYTQDPQISKVIQLEIIKNAEGSELSGVQEWARSQLVEAGAEKPNPEEQAAMSQPKPPSAQELALQAYAKKQNADAMLAEAQISKTQTEALKNIAMVEQLKAQVEVTLQDSDQAHRKLILDEVAQLHSMMQDQIANAPQAMPPVDAPPGFQPPAPPAPIEGPGSGASIGKGLATPHL